MKVLSIGILRGLNEMIHRVTALHLLVVLMIMMTVPRLLADSESVFPTKLQIP